MDLNANADPLRVWCSSAEWDVNDDIARTTWHLSMELAATDLLIRIESTMLR